MPIKIRKTLLHEPITFDTIGNHWDQVPIYRPNGYPLYHYLQTEKGVGKIEIQGKSYLLNENLKKFVSLNNEINDFYSELSANYGDVE